MAKNETLNQQRLTSDNLSNIPRRNHILYLSDYLREQHSYAKEYASEGLPMLSWTHTVSPAPKINGADRSTALDDFLLGTPVLKARAPAAVIVRSSAVLEPLDSTGDQATRKSTRDTARKTLLGLNSSVAQDNPTGGNVDKSNGFDRKQKPRESKKRMEDEREGSDDDHLKRLQERRERKRLKKNIMKLSARNSESEKENSIQILKKKGDKKDKTKSQASFALMHGFMATNVGKSRITLEPLLRNVGVFKKGKASCALKTGKLATKKRDDHDVCFSEARFLKSTPANHIDSKSSSASSSSSGNVYKKKVTVKRNENLTVFKKGNKIGGESVEDSNCGDIADQKEASAPEEDLSPYDPAKSIIWDIERESYVETEASCRQGTIVLSFPRDLLAHGGDEEKRKDATPVVTTDVCPGNRADANAAFTKTSDSLHPSQSASQVVQEQSKGEIRNHGMLAISKYFVPENITMTEADGNCGHRQQDLYEVPRSMTQGVSESRQEDLSIVHESPPRIVASPTLSQIYLDLFHEPPRSYDAFSHADIRSVFEDPSMVLDDIRGPDAPRDPDFWSRSDGELLTFDAGLQSMQYYDMLENADCSFGSGNLMEHDLGFEDPPVFQAEDFCCLPSEWCRQNVQTDVAHEGGCDPDVGLCDCSVDYESGAGYETYDAYSGNDTSSIALTEAPIISMPNEDNSSEDDICVGCSPMVGHFSQGRSLLYGLDHDNVRGSDAEAEVAKILKQNHWLPHRL